MVLPSFDGSQNVKQARVLEFISCSRMNIINFAGRRFRQLSVNHVIWSQFHIANTISSAFPRVNPGSPSNGHCIFSSFIPQTKRSRARRISGTVSPQLQCCELTQFYHELRASFAFSCDTAVEFKTLHYRTRPGWKVLFQGEDNLRENCLGRKAVSIKVQIALAMFRGRRVRSYASLISTLL